MELQVLGPLELRAKGQRIHLGGHRQRVVLAVLALNANRATSVELLTDAVWGGAAPATARAQIQTCVSALRRLLADAGHPAQIETRVPGYLLDVAAEHLDLARFGRLVAEAASHTREGEPAAGLAKLRLAVQLWRGEPLADLDSEVVRRYTVTLTERYRQAQLECARLEIELGAHAEAVAVLQDLVAGDPYSEEPHRLLMLALHRSGRQAQALEVYRRARTLFVDQLGIEPSQRLVELERTILNGASRPALVADSGQAAHAADFGQAAHAADFGQAAHAAEEVPRLLPADLGDFTGRARELTAAVAHLSTGSPGRPGPPLLSISGPAGVGKSALAVHAAHACAAHFTDGQLYASLRDSTADEVRIQLLYALGVERRSIPEDRHLQAGLLRSKLAGKRILLLLDDVRAEEQLTGLLPGSPTCGVIVTSRRRLAGLSGACRIDLEAFGTGEALEFLDRVLGGERIAAERETAEDIVRCCDRLPLALRIAANRLIARPQWSLAQLAERLATAADPLEELSHGAMDLGTVLGDSERELSPRGALLLGLLALAEPATCTAWIAAALLDTGIAEAQALLEDLVDARLLQPVGAARFRLPALVRLHAERILAAKVSPGSRRAVLARLNSAWLALAERAHYEVYGSDHVVARGSAPRWLASGPLPPGPATDPLGWLKAEGAALLGAVRSACSHGDDELCWELSVVLASLFTCNRQLEQSRIAIDLGRLAARRAASPTGMAAVEYARGVLALTRQELEAARIALTSAMTGFAACDDPHGYAMALIELAALDCANSDGTAALAKCATASAALPDPTDRAAEVRLLCVSANALTRLGGTAAAHARLDEALVVAREIDYRRSETYLLYQKSLVCMADGDPDQVAAFLDRALQLAVEFADPLIEAIIRAALGRQACAAKAWHLATSHLAAAAALFDDLGCECRTAEVEPALMTALTEAVAELAPL